MIKSTSPSAHDLHTQSIATRVHTRTILAVLCFGSIGLMGCPKKKPSPPKQDPPKIPSIVPNSPTKADKKDKPNAPSKTTEKTTKKTTPNKPAPNTPIVGGIKFASWNIEWLHRQNGQGKTPRTQADYDALKRYANRLNADVIALQEVDGPQAASRVFDPKVYNFHFESRNSVQRVGFAYKKALNVTKHPDVTDFQLGRYDRLRRGVDMTVKGPSGRSIRVLAVHLKSSCWSSPFNGPVRGRERPEACRILKDQNNVLRRWMDAQRNKGLPFVVLGDFNRRLKPRETFWLNLQKSKSKADLVSPTLTKRSTCMGGRYPDYIDHAIFDQRAARGFSMASFAQITFDRSDRSRKLSDHCPIRVTWQPR